MHHKFFGDSYDLVKRDIIHGLALAEEWAAHPMYFDPIPVAGFVDRYAEFLGIDLAARHPPRGILVNVSRACRRHLFLDPDTGLWKWQSNPGNRWHKHISMEELAQIANAPGREHRLTLVFDQSYSRSIGNEARRQRAEKKLQTLRCDHGVHGVAYVSHAVFIWVSRDEDLLARATRRLRARSRLPRCRFVDDGCGQHITA